jgi:ABC-type cobalamin/Fe3+-siderophores transport system ATPase subunit
MTFVTRVRSVTFSDGRELEVPETGVVVLVGPNNSGKSAALREIYRLLTGVSFQAHEPPLRVVRGGN